MKKIAYSIIFLFLAAPAAAFADDGFHIQVTGGFGGGCDAPCGIAGLIVKIKQLIDLVIPVIIALALVAALWGIFLYIAQGRNEEKRKEGRKFIFWAIIALFIMISVWGFVNILVRTFDLDNRIDRRSIPVLPYIVPDAQDANRSSE